MKKNKVVLLSILAVGIWSFIGFKIIAGSEEGVSAPSQRTTQRKGVSVDSVETFTFNFSYQDPFLKRKLAVKKAAIATKKNNNLAVVKPSRIVLHIKWERIKYKGSMRNTIKKTTIATVSLDGNDYIVHPGESIGDFKIEDILPDSIHVSCDGNFHFVRKED